MGTLGRLLASILLTLSLGIVSASTVSANSSIVHRESRSAAGAGTGGLSYLTTQDLAPGHAATGDPGRAGNAGPGYGIKSWIVKQSLRATASLVRNGKFYRLADPFLDEAAEQAMRKNAGKVADVIDDVANLTDIATHRVRSEVYKRLSGSLGHGTANVIANAVEGVMWLLL